MSPQGRPKGEHRSAQREGSPMSERGEAKACSARPRAIAGGRQLDAASIGRGAEAEA